MIPGHASENNPRKIIGLKGNMFYSFDISGRLTPGMGMDIASCAHMVEKIGLDSALLLDGGGSVATYYKLKNTNCCNDLLHQNDYGERPLPLYIYAESKD